MKQVDTPWALSHEALFEALATRSSGLTATEAASRLLTAGPNRVTDQGDNATWRALKTQLRNPLGWLLVFASVVSAVAGEWADAIVVVSTLVLSAMLGFFQERKANRVAEQLRARISTKVTVRRDGRESPCTVDDLVPGDLIALAAGSLVPADAVVLESKECFVNQAILTGETFPTEKQSGMSAPTDGLAERANMVFAGTNVRSGTALALVVSTGKGTELGHLASRLHSPPPETEFDHGIRQFGYLLTRVMFVLVLVVFAGSILHSKPAAESLLFAIALAVGLAPEMLPAVLAVTLSRGAREMAKRGVLVRHLSAIEDLGSTGILCTDKTGTLTVGSVTLERATDIDGLPSERVLELAHDNARLQTDLPNPLDEAICRATAAMNRAPREKLDEVPYDFVRKRLTVVVAAGDDRLLIMKGAFERTLEVCRFLQTAKGPTALDADRRAALLSQFLSWSVDGVRVLGWPAVSYRAAGRSVGLTR